MAHYKGDRLGLVLAFWGLGLVLGTPQVSQTDHDGSGQIFGSLLNHVTVGRNTHGESHCLLQLVAEHILSGAWPALSAGCSFTFHKQLSSHGQQTTHLCHC